MTDQPGLFDQQNTNEGRYQSLVQPLEPIVFSKNKDTGALNSVPENAQFRFTRNYEISGNYLGHVVKNVDRLMFESQNISMNDITQEVTIPQKRLQSIISYLRKSEILNENYHLTNFGKLLYSNDPFFLDKGGLWLLHYIISSNANLILWARLFNILLIPGIEVAPREYLVSFDDVKGGMSEKNFLHNGGSEIGAILKTYSDGLFKPLKLISRSDHGTYTFVQDDYHIPELPLLACILVFRDRYFPGAASLEINHLISSDYSPGKILRLHEIRIRSALDQLHNQGLLTVETRLGLDQVRFKNDFSWLDALSLYFGGQN